MGKPTPRKLPRKRCSAGQRTEPPRPQVAIDPHAQAYGLIEPVFRTEQAIYTAFVGGGRQLCDGDVRATLERLIEELRRGHVQAAAGSVDDEVSYLVRSFWDDLPACPPADELIDILQSILGSIEVWRSPSPNSRGYLSYLEGFMKKAGVCCQVVGPDEQLPGSDDSGLLAIGRTWCGGEQPAGEVFRALAEQMIADGHAEQVLETCQHLIGERPPTAIFRQLSMLAIDAQRFALRRVC
jgi:hypothetical protein